LDLFGEKAATIKIRNFLGLLTISKWLRKGQGLGPCWEQQGRAFLDGFDRDEVPGIEIRKFYGFGAFSVGCPNREPFPI
jgi:hypothetical protein